MNKKITDTPLVPRAYLLPFLLVTFLFFLWALPNNLNDILIKQFMKSFELNRLEAGLVQSAFYLGYFIFALPAALIMERFGYKRGLIMGLLLFALGCFLFYPATLVGKYGFFLFALFVIASGLAFLETGSNSLVTLLGAPDSAERRLNFTQAFNPIGAISGVAIGNIFIFSGIEPSATQEAAMKAAGTYTGFLREETLRIGPPYIVIGLVVILWAILIYRTKFPAVADISVETDNEKGSLKALWHFPHFTKGVLAQFFYIGAQVGTWSFFIQYVQDYTMASEKVAANFLMGTLVAFGVGRFAATWLMKSISPGTLMGIFSGINVLLVSIGIIFPGSLGMWAIFFTSFFMSLMFPTIFALGVKGLGHNTKRGGSIIVMAIIGGAVWTPLMGLIADQTGSMALAMLIPLLSYLYIIYYAFSGSRIAPVTLANHE